MFFLIQISSLILFIGILKFVKLLRFNNRFAVLILTLKTAWEDLLGFFAVFFLVFFAFVQVGCFFAKKTRRYKIAINAPVFFGYVSYFYLITTVQNANDGNANIVDYPFLTRCLRRWLPPEGIYNYWFIIIKRSEFVDAHFNKK